MTHKEVIAALRSTPTRSKRELLDTDLTQFERFVARYERNMHKPWNKPKTNADRIRAMSDEELAWELMTWRIEAEAKHHGVESNYPNTRLAIQKWLQQPADHFREATKKEDA